MAAGVVVQVAVLLAVRSGWLFVPLVYGFVARVLAGPRLSPLGRLVTTVITPRVDARRVDPPRFVPGQPKRFAQAIGVVCSASAAAAWWGGWHVVALAVVGLLGLAASLEAVAGLCLGCLVFARLMRWGMIPSDVCQACADVTERLAALATAANVAETATAANTANTADTATAATAANLGSVGYTGSAAGMAGVRG